MYVDAMAEVIAVSTHCAASLWSPRLALLCNVDLWFSSICVDEFWNIMGDSDLL